MAGSVIQEWGCVHLLDLIADEVVDVRATGRKVEVGGSLNDRNAIATIKPRVEDSGASALHLIWYRNDRRELCRLDQARDG